MQNKEFPRTVRGFYWLIIKKFPWYFGLMFSCGIIGCCLDMIFGPLTTKWTMQIFENAATADFGFVFRILCFLAIMFISTATLNFIGSVAYGRKQEIFNRYKLYVLYKRIYDNDISFFIDHPLGQIGSQVSEISSRLNELMEKFYAEIFGTILGFIFLVGSMFVMNVWMVVALAAYGVIKVVWEWYIQRKINKNSEILMEEGSKYSGMRSDSLTNALTVKYFANTKYENQYIYKGRDKLIELQKHARYLSRWQWMPTRILWIFMRLGMLFFCFILIKNNQLSISDAAFVIVSMQTINTMFGRLNSSLQKYSVSYARVKKAYANVIVDKVVKDKANAKRLSTKNAVISFEHVDFAYGNNKVFKDFNLKINKSEKVGIVGLSGAGKTTLCNLLLRMYDVDKGAVKINDIDIRDITQDSLRKTISFVPQEPNLFNRTLLDNIRYAKPHAAKTDVINAAKKANIHDFISKLPKGYDTLVGNNGIKLSGGQRQRVSIARALVKDAPILMLDEATSALDSKNEMMIQKSLKIAMRGKTTLVIAHRLSTLANMDRIVVIKNGKIVEAGSPTQLLHKNGVYSKLWRMQTRKK